MGRATVRAQRKLPLAASLRLLAGLFDWSATEYDRFQSGADRRLGMRCTATLILSGVLLDAVQ